MNKDRTQAFIQSLEKAKDQPFEIMRKFMELTEHQRNAAICKKAVELEPRCLEGVPRQYISEGLCITAVSRNAQCLKHVPLAFRDRRRKQYSKPILKAAWENDPRQTVEALPSASITEELLLYGLRKGFDLVSPQSVQEKHFSEAVAEAAFPVRWQAFDKFPASLENYMDYAVLVAQKNSRFAMRCFKRPENFNVLKLEDLNKLISVLEAIDMSQEVGRLVNRSFGKAVVGCVFNQKLSDGNIYRRHEYDRSPEWQDQLAFCVELIENKFNIELLRSQKEDVIKHLSTNKQSRHQQCNKMMTL